MIVRGEPCEGGEYEGVCSSLELARNKVRGRIDDTWDEINHVQWKNTYDCITIESWDVATPPKGLVWMVVRKRPYEGSDCRAICVDEASARANVAHIIAEQLDGPWIERDRTWIQGTETIVVEPWVVDGDLDADVKEPDQN
jgi:hypothetical protein